MLYYKAEGWEISYPDTLRLTKSDAATNRLSFSLPNADDGEILVYSAVLADRPEGETLGELSKGFLGNPEASLLRAILAYQRETIRSSGATVLSERMINVGGHSAAEFIYEDHVDGDRSYIRKTTFVHGKLLIDFTIVMPSSIPVSPLIFDYQELLTTLQFR